MNKGCNKKFWSNKFGNSLIPYPFRLLFYDRIECGTNFLFEGKAFCKECIEKGGHRE